VLEVTSLNPIYADHGDKINCGWQGIELALGMSAEDLSMPVDGDLKRLPRQRATVSNETGSELGQEFRGDSDNAFRQK
jgi:hypothetical protein